MGSILTAKTASPRPLRGPIDFKGKPIALIELKTKSRTMFQEI